MENWRPFCSCVTLCKQGNRLLWTTVQRGTIPVVPMQSGFVPHRQPIHAIEAVRLASGSAADGSAGLLLSSLAFEKGVPPA